MTLKVIEDIEDVAFLCIERDRLKRHGRDLTAQQILDLVK